MDESGISLTPPVRRTWAPMGQTPIIRTPFNAKRMSMAAVLADASEAKVMFDGQPGADNDPNSITFMRQLRYQLPGDKVTLIWRGPSSSDALVPPSQRSWLVVERRGDYAPDLNAVEGLWSNLNGTQLANLCVDAIAETEYQARRGIRRIRRENDLAFGFVRHTGLLL